MDEDGVVSLWIGTAVSEAALERALDVSFSEEGDFLGSEFSRVLNLGYYDSGLLEAEYRPEDTTSLRELLRGVSFEAQIVPTLERQTEFDEQVNCFVLLYNHRFSGKNVFFASGVNLRFIGTANYRNA
jgi:hypothetical protein